MTRVAIVVPTLGQRLDYLEQNLRSISSQGLDVQIVIVRPLKVSEHVDKLAETYGAKVVDDPAEGLSRAVNVGVSMLDSSVEYFNWLGDDDFLTPESLSNAVRMFDTHEQAVLVYGNCKYLDDLDRELFVAKPGKFASRSMAFAPNKIPQPGALMRVSAFEKLGGLNEELRFAMDLDLWLRIRRLGKLIYVDAVLANYRWHKGSLSAMNGKASFEEARRSRLSNGAYLETLLARIFDWLALKLGVVDRNRLDRM